LKWWIGRIGERQHFSSQFSSDSNIFSVFSSDSNRRIDIGVGKIDNCSIEMKIMQIRLCQRILH